jgi:hypothetical protein
MGSMVLKVKALQSALNAWAYVADTNASICKLPKFETL